MELKDMILPVAVTVRVDDVGWFEGEDGRYGNRPDHVIYKIRRDENVDAVKILFK